MNEVNTLAASIGTYGLYTIIACLVIAVVYLFKKVNELHGQIQQILIDQSKAAAELTIRVTTALEASTRLIERLERYLDKTD